MAVSEISPLVGDFLFYKPDIESIEATTAKKLDFVLSQADSDIELDLSRVTRISNKGARILSRALRERNIRLIGAQPQIETSLQWATDYLDKHER